MSEKSQFSYIFNRSKGLPITVDLDLEYPNYRERRKEWFYLAKV
jgi:hypothetical protein